MTSRTILAVFLNLGFCIVSSLPASSGGARENRILIRIMMHSSHSQYYRIELSPEGTRFSYIRDTLGQMPGEPVAIQDLLISNESPHSKELRAVARRLAALQKTSVIYVPSQNDCPQTSYEVPTSLCLMEVSTTSAMNSQLFLDDHYVITQCMFGQSTYSKDRSPRILDKWEPVFRSSYLCFREVTKRFYPDKYPGPYSQFCSRAGLRIFDSGDMLCRYLGDNLMGVSYAKVGKLLMERDQMLRMAYKAGKKEKVMHFDTGFSDFKKWVQFNYAKEK